MKTSLFYPDWDYRKDNTKQHPILRVITSQPTGFWFGSSPSRPIKRVQSRVHRLLKRAYPFQPVLVLYSIPNRDLGHYSRGGHQDESKYIEFIHEFTKGLGKYNPIVIFEPDAIPHIPKMSFEDGLKRIQLIRKCLSILSQSNAMIYLDIGHPEWLTPHQVKKYLNFFQLDKVKGFSINTSNYYDLTTCHQWGDKISQLVGLTYVIDTSRNGKGSLGQDEWCNPPNRGLGVFPTTRTSSKYCDAYLWIKVPGESDGTQNGGPKAGRFYLEQALSLIENI